MYAANNTGKAANNVRHGGKNKLSVQDIVKTFQQKSERRQLCFEKIIENVFKRIEKSVVLSRFACLYEVPEFMLGFPLYDLNECVVYILQQLHKNGFIVRYFFPRVLHISWETQEVKDKTLSENLRKLNLSNMIGVPPLSIPYTGNLPVPAIGSQSPNHHNHHHNNYNTSIQQNHNIGYNSHDNPRHLVTPVNIIDQVIHNEYALNDNDNGNTDKNMTLIRGQRKGSGCKKKKTKPVAEFKPSGKFILNI